MAYTLPTVAEFKTYFFRDFPYGQGLNTVIDQDIENAFSRASANINEGIFDTQSDFTLGYLLLSAHQLVTALRASSQGVQGAYNFLDASKSVGSVNESFAIPQRILDNPNFSMLAKTTYGAMYLEMVLPRIIGQIFPVEGGTLA